MQGLKEHWIDIALLILFVYQWEIKGLLWWIALMSIGWAINQIITRE